MRDVWWGEELGRSGREMKLEKEQFEDSIMAISHFGSRDMLAFNLPSESHLDLRSPLSQSHLETHSTPISPL
jgi:hypothetical protein